MDVIEAVRARRSAARVEGDLSREEIAELIEAARWAPNHYVTEPWRFTVLTGAARERLGEAWAPIAADHQGLTGEVREKFIDGERRKPLRAPVLIVVSTRTDPDPVTATEDLAATAAAVQNLLLVAHAKGYAAMWRTGPLAYDPRVKRHLGLDESDRIVSIVYLGRTATQPPKTQERKFDEVVRWLG